MRIHGRTLRPATLAERRLLLTVAGTTALRVPRSENPYVIARLLRRIAGGRHSELLLVREVVQHNRKALAPSPGLDSPEAPQELPADGTQAP